MKRTLLLIPVLALLIIACRQKHATTTATPPAPDPNAYSNVPPTVVITPNQASEEVAPVGSGSGSSSGSTTNDTVVTNVSMPTEVTPAPADTTLSRLVVSFISKGEGTDGAAKENLDKWLSKNVAVKYTVVTWGREGEVDYIFDLRDHATVRQQKVVDDVRALIGINDRVLIQEWAEGHKARNTGIVDPIPTVEDTTATRLVVSFISKGEGIDYKTKDEFEKWLGMRGNVTWETTSWGREGEVNFCFRLSNMQTREQDIFVRDVRTFFTDKELVLISEWAACDKRK